MSFQEIFSSPSGPYDHDDVALHESSHLASARRDFHLNPTPRRSFSPSDLWRYVPISDDALLNVDLKSSAAIETTGETTEIPLMGCDSSLCGGQLFSAPTVDGYALPIPPTRNLGNIDVAKAIGVQTRSPHVASGGVITPDISDQDSNSHARSTIKDRMNIITSFELLFLAAVAKHLPSLVPLLPKSSEERLAGISTESKKRFRSQVYKNRTCNKRPRNGEVDKFLDVKKAVDHLETEFRYNSNPSNERKASLPRFTGLDIYAVDDWFKKKSGFRPEEVTGRPYVSRSGQQLAPSVKHVDSHLNMSCNFGFSTEPQTKGEDKVITRPVVVSEDEKDTINHFPFLGLNMDIHKPFLCTKKGCSTKFKSRSDWRRHEETHYPQLGYTCLLTPECESKIFPRKDKFLEHLKRFHDNYSYTPDMKEWQKPIASLSDLCCPVCNLSFSGWQERCDHIAEMIEGSRGLLEEQTSFNSISSSNRRGRKQREFRMNLCEEGKAPGKGLSDPPTSQYRIEKLREPQGMDKIGDGAEKSHDVMKRFAAQHLVHEIPQINLF